MVEDGPQPRTSLTPANPLVETDRRARGAGPPPLVDAEFKVLPPVWRPWRALRDSWWAVGPYLAYCTALWGLAALVGWLMDRSRTG